jgi:hypothetical protein
MRDTLQHLQILELLAADGLATPAQEAELGAAGIDPCAGRAFRTTLGRALSPGELEPDLAPSIVGRVDLPDPSLALTAALAMDEAVDVVDAVLAELGLGDGWATVHAGLQIGEDEAPDLADAVMAEAMGGMPDLAGLLLDAAGPAPDLADAIMAELSLDASSGDEAPMDNVVRLRPRWPQVGLAMAAAAALVLAVMGSPADVDGDADALAWNLSPTNELNIEALESDAMVQIFQFDEGGPTIIWVDDMDDIDLFGDEEGVAL